MPRYALILLFLTVSVSTFARKDAGIESCNLEPLAIDQHRDAEYVTELFKALKTVKAKLEDSAIDQRTRENLQKEKRYVFGELSRVLYPYFLETARKISKGGFVILGPRTRMNVPLRMNPDEMVNQAIVHLDKMKPEKYYDVTRTGSAGLTTYFNVHVGNAVWSTLKSRRMGTLNYNQFDEAHTPHPLEVYAAKKHIEHARADLSGTDDRRLMADLLKEMPVEDASVLFLRFEQKGSMEALASQLDIGVEEAKLRLERAKHLVYVRLPSYESQYPEAVARLETALNALPGGVPSNARTARHFFKYPKMAADVPPQNRPYLEAVLAGTRPGSVMDEKTVRSSYMAVQSFLQSREFDRPDSVKHQLFLLRYHEGELPEHLTDLSLRAKAALVKVPESRRGMAEDYLFNGLSMEQICEKYQLSDQLFRTHMPIALRDIEKALRLEAISSTTRP